MYIHPILQGFINFGYDDYLVKSITNPKVVKEIWVHPTHGKDYIRHQQVNVNNTSSSSKHNKSTNDEDTTSNLDKEIIPGVRLRELIGEHENDRHLAKSFPRFHKLYTKPILGMKTGTDQTITLMDFTHFPKRVKERGYQLVKDRESYERHFGNRNPDYAIKRLPKKLQEDIRSLSSKQESKVAQYVYDTLAHPAFTLKGSSTVTPQGSTMYVSWDCCVIVVNLPKRKGVVKTFFPTRKSIRVAIEQGWDGSIPLEDFKKNMDAMS